MTPTPPLLLHTPVPWALQIKTGIKGNLKTGNVFNNREVLAAMNVDLNMLPYVYDTFKWDHCLEVGVDFNDAWEMDSSAAAAAAADKAKKKKTL